MPAAFAKCRSSCPKMRTEPKSRILEALSKFAETSRRGSGSAIRDPEQTSPPDHPFRPTGAPELLCSVAVVIAEQAAQSLTTSHLPVGTTDAFFRFEQRVPKPLQVRDPELVRACGVEVALHEVHRASAARIRLRRLESTSTDRALEAHFTHQTGHRASSHDATLTAKLTPDLAHAIHVKVLLPYTTNLAAKLDVALRSRWLAAWVLLSRFLLVIGRRGDREHPADRLDPVLCQNSAHLK